jgi:hypothetical protein
MGQEYHLHDHAVQCSTVVIQIMMKHHLLKLLETEHGSGAMVAI